MVSFPKISGVLLPPFGPRAPHRAFNIREQTSLTHFDVFLRFLLHYISRDEVDLLSRGTGGVPDVRNAIDNYEETSPLYGFLHYRRRKVILRYMPEGLSRLIQGKILSQRPERREEESKLRSKEGCDHRSSDSDWNVPLLQLEAMFNFNPSPTSSPQTILYSF